MTKSGEYYATKNYYKYTNKYLSCAAASDQIDQGCGGEVLRFSLRNSQPVSNVCLKVRCQRSAKCGVFLQIRLFSPAGKVDRVSY